MSLTHGGYTREYVYWLPSHACEPQWAASELPVIVAVHCFGCDAYDTQVRAGCRIGGLRADRAAGAEELIEHAELLRVCERGEHFRFRIHRIRYPPPQLETANLHRCNALQQQRSRLQPIRAAAASQPTAAVALVAQLARDRTDRRPRPNWTVRPRPARGRGLGALQWGGTTDSLLQSE